MSEVPSPNPQEQLITAIDAAAHAQGTAELSDHSVIDGVSHGETMLHDSRGDLRPAHVTTDVMRHGATVESGTEPGGKSSVFAETHRRTAEGGIVDGGVSTSHVATREHTSHMRANTSFKDGHTVTRNIHVDLEKGGRPTIQTSTTSPENGFQFGPEKPMTDRQMRAAARLARLSFGLQKGEGSAPTEKAA